jgi:hypothetical protein
MPTDFGIYLDDDLTALLLRHARNIPDADRDAWFRFLASVLRPQQHNGIDRTTMLKACRAANARYWPPGMETSNG